MLRPVELPQLARPNGFYAVYDVCSSRDALGRLKYTGPATAYAIRGTAELALTILYHLRNYRQTHSLAL
jgi:hypothetical protein